MFCCDCTGGSKKLDPKTYSVEGLKKQKLQSDKIPEQRTQLEVSNTAIINDRFEFLGISADESVFKDVESKFGNRYIRNHFNYKEIEIAYETLGLIFVFDSYGETIRKIIIKPPFQAVTSRGITLGKSTIQEALDVYEKTMYRPGEWTERKLEEKPHLCLEYGYPRYFPPRSISFCAEKNPSLPRKSVDKTFYLHQKIQRIFIH
ncbi:hypothetical protein EHQ12_08550 [Leptospira gomenensis]|uniref:Uncharacterized protein n=1 Tax=Leptospira gomenensis TaxID=2484974 RepID=A0A5F1YDB5_9LEPT|nr:hypothetical protein EHQ17_04740 [Leptospira gomenensis]TGK40087.1 hypothetical protein EHQ12_08550 [Leptospira gomenensis]TGK51562.1 hypothetical protein EHQ07_02945 [Leptospira gomenensis]TGK68115.1 hypothetical protein EHQ13_01475 [Leptospira gomenensis]